MAASIFFEKIHLKRVVLQQLLKGRFFF